MGGFHARRSLSGKESIKRICDSIAAENNAWPYIPLTNGQFYIMNRLYWGDIWKTRRDDVTAEVLIAFCVLKNAVEYFKKSAHMLFIDGGHCGDGWKIRVASLLDCNHSIQPIGFELCQGESNTSWVIFLQALKEAGIGSPGSDDLQRLRTGNPNGSVIRHD